MLDYWSILKEQEADNGLTNDELKAAIEHLANCIYLILDIREDMKIGAMDLQALSERSERCWDEMNKCRVYTERILFMEEALIPAMGLMYDVKSMFDSLIAWKMGMTIHAAFNIRGCLNQVEPAVRQCLSELESWMTTVENGAPTFVEVEVDG